MRVNYHIHTTHSDGGDTVSEVIKRLKLDGVESFAITDHDQIVGNIEARRLADSLGMRHINGIEISCRLNGQGGLSGLYTAHILGLDFDYIAMENKVKKIIEYNAQMIDELVDRLILDGYKGFKRAERWRMTYMSFVARQLVERGYAPNISTAFSQILDKNYHNYSVNLPTIAEAIAAIHDCGGVAIMAHPLTLVHCGKLQITVEQMQEIVDAASGLDGIEAYYQKYTREQILRLVDFARQRSLFMSVGTDYHNRQDDTIKSPKGEQLHFGVQGIDTDFSICRHFRKSTDKFSGMATVYERARPNYSEDAIDFILKKFPRGGIVADIGSGTGKLTEQLLRRDIVSKVYAVEPNADMRAVAEKKLAGDLKFVSIAASAEATGLDCGSVDLVVAAQAFHWFDCERFRVECDRIMATGGKVVLMWNRSDSSGAMREEEWAILKKYCLDYSSPYGRDARVAEFFGSSNSVLEYENEMQYEKNGYVSACMSRSYAPREGEPNYVPLKEALGSLFDKYQVNGVLNVSYPTFVYYSD